MDSPALKYRSADCAHRAPEKITNRTGKYRLIGPQMRLKKKGLHRIIDFDHAFHVPGGMARDSDSFAVQLAPKFASAARSLTGEQLRLAELFRPIRDQS